jgi:hypothetical protein
MTGEMCDTTFYRDIGRAEIRSGWVFTRSARFMYMLN